MPGFPSLLESEFGPGNLRARSWNLLGNDADAKMCAFTQLYSIYHIRKKCLNSVFAISLQHVTVMTVYSSIDAAIILYTYG